MSKTLSPSPSGESPQAQGPAEQDIKGVLKGTEVAQTRNIYIYVYILQTAAVLHMVEKH